jgi:hypothetical protein
MAHLKKKKLKEKSSLQETIFAQRRFSNWPTFPYKFGTVLFGKKNLKKCVIGPKMPEKHINAMFGPIE